MHVGSILKVQVPSFRGLPAEDYISQKSPGTGLLGAGRVCLRRALRSAEPLRIFRLLFPMSLWAQTNLRFCVPSPSPQGFGPVRGGLVAPVKGVRAGGGGEGSVDFRAGSKPAGRVGVTPRGARSEKAPGADRACRAWILKPVFERAAERLCVTDGVTRPGGMSL